MKIIKTVVLILFLIFLLFISGCQSRQQLQQPFPVLEGDYLGQPFPGMTPELFAPGIISDRFNEQNAVFSPEHSELFYTLTDAYHNLGIIMSMTRGKYQWNLPQILSFSGQYLDLNPFVSCDGRHLYFVSNRPSPGHTSSKTNLDIWVVNRNGAPVVKNLGPGINSEADENYISLNSLNQIYFSSDRDNGLGMSDIYLADRDNGSYSRYINLGPPVNTAFRDEGPCISGNDKLLIFCSDRPGGQGGLDMYICFKTREGLWSIPINMGSDINTRDNEFGPAISPDNKYLFFSRSGGRIFFDSKVSFSDTKTMLKKLDGPKNGLSDIYWVDIQLIEKIKLNIGP